jgi:hypothetical protein
MGRATHGAVADNSCLDLGGLHKGPLNLIQGHGNTYRIAVGRQQGRKVRVGAMKTVMTA